jgi:hypothetical protein
MKLALIESSVVTEMSQNWPQIALLFIRRLFWMTRNMCGFAVFYPAVPLGKVVPIARTSHVHDNGVSMISKKPLYVQQLSTYVFPGVTKQIHLSGLQTGDEFSLNGAAMPSGGAVSLPMDPSTPGFPDPEQMQKLLALAEEFGVRILAAPALSARN